MSKHDYRDNESVDITIRATVRGVFDDEGEPVIAFEYQAPGRDDVFANLTLTDAVTVKRITPAEGEPKPGDVWRDGEGCEWFAHSLSRSDYVTMRDSTGNDFTPARVNEVWGPLTLVYRPESTPKAGPVLATSIADGA